MDKKVTIIFIITAIVFLGGIFWGDSLTQSPKSNFSSDFKNEEFAAESSTVLPDEVRQRFEDQLVEHQKEQEIADNPYTAYLGEALAIMQLGNYRASLKKFEELEDRYSGDYLVTMDKGDLLVRMGQYLSAADTYQQAINKKPVETMPHLKLADLYFKHSANPEGAENVLKSALVDTVENIEILKAYARFLEKYKQNYTEAIIYWNKALKRSASLESSNAIKEEINELKALLLVQ